MSESARVMINTVMEKRDILRVGQTAILRTPPGPIPGIAVLQQALEDHARDLTMCHQSVEMLVQIGFFMHLEIMQVSLVDFIFRQQCFTPTPGPMTEHLFIERTRPPFDHTTFVNQAAGKFRESAALCINWAVDHLLDWHIESFTLFDQNFDVSRDTRVH